MLLFGAMAVAIYVVFVLILAPMANARDNLERQNQEAAQTLAEVRALASEYQGLSGAGPGARSAGGNLTVIVDSTVKANQLKMARFQPSSLGDVQVRFENALFNNIVAWLNDLEANNGVLIKDLSLTPGAAKGLVNVSVRLGLSG